MESIVTWKKYLKYVTHSNEFQELILLGNSLLYEDKTSAFSNNTFSVLVG